MGSNGASKSAYGQGGHSPRNGGRGGATNSHAYRRGGFGGGGSHGYDAGGGGGGYTGGNGAAYHAGGYLDTGGSSYTAGSRVSCQNGGNDGHGYVIVEIP